MLQVGDRFPDFCLRDQDGKERTRDDLFDFFTVVYFYLKDDSSECSKEAVDFRNMLKDISSRQVQVIGVSPDSFQSHKIVSERLTLPFKLLSDEHRVLAKKCGILKEKEVLGMNVASLERTTFILDKQGVILWQEVPVNLENHTSRVAGYLKKLLLSS